MKKLLLFVLFLLTAQLAVAQEPAIPPYSGFVNDFAGQCTAEQISQLNSLVEGIERDTTAEVAVVTMNSCGSDPFDFRVRMFKEWGIGKAATDNGLLILACLEERTLEQETGYGTEGILPDLLTSRVAQEQFVPQAREGNLCQGLINVVQAYAPIIRGEPEPTPAPAPAPNAAGAALPQFVTICILALIILIVIVFIAMAIGGGSSGPSRPRSSSNYGGGGFSGGGSSSRSSFGGSSSRSSSSRSSSSSSSSSSRSSFGGGKSGGGGSSTKW